MKVNSLEQAITLRSRWGHRKRLAYDPWFEGAIQVPSAGYVFSNSNEPQSRETHAAVIAKSTEEREQLWNKLLSDRKSEMRYHGRKIFQHIFTAKPAQ